MHGTTKYQYFLQFAVCFNVKGYQQANDDGILCLNMQLVVKRDVIAIDSCVYGIIVCYIVTKYKVDT